MWFKRPPKIKPYAQLRGSEVKRLHTAICKQYSSTSDVADGWLPKNASIQHARFLITDPLTGSQQMDGTLYSIRSSPTSIEPMAFQVENLIYPTIYAFYKVPGLLPILYTNIDVFPRMVNGADLMLPGLKCDEDNYPLPEFQQNDLLAIAVAGGNTVPLAIGFALISSEETIRRFASNNPAERRGKVASIIHVIHDALWLTGSKSTPPELESSGADEQLAESIQSLSVLNNADDCTLAAESSRQKQAADEAETGPSKDPISSEEMDKLLHKSLCYAIVNLMGKAEYPISSSSLFTDYMQPGCPEDYELDIKQSSFKKFSKFLKFAAKRGLVRVKETRQGDLDVLSVDPKHEDCLSLDRYRAKHKSVKPQNTDTAENEADGSSSVTPIHYKVFYQPKSAFLTPEDWREICRSVGCENLLSRASGGDEKQYFTADEVKLIVKAYSDKLADPKDRRWLILDERMSIIMRNYNPQAEESDGDQLRYDRRDMLKIFMAQMHEFYTFSQDMSDMRRGKPPMISVKEVKHGRRQITTINNLKVYANNIDPKRLVHDLQVLCAGSTSMDDKLPKQGTKCDGLEIKVQGNHSKVIAKLLTTQYGIPPDLINI